MPKKIKVWIEKIPTWVIILLLFILGMLFYITSQGTYAEFDKWIYSSAVKKFLESMGMTIVSASLVSLVVEISSLKNLFQSAFKGVLNFDFPFDCYSDKQLEKLNKRLAVYRTKCNLEEKDIEESVYEYE
ncbi:MAG: hypothetical protein ACI39N_09160, partial [Lachnospiraceae bacterium]